ncbi:MAG: hypothetical protein KDC84_06660 [Crocinitomicaceae bacterium]|nr:hypothetical protein [Crocinitomicaceae bacterium]
MRQLFFLLLLFPVFPFAQIKVNIEITSFRSQTVIPYVKIQLGDRSLSTNSGGTESFTLYDERFLKDTLFLFHPEYIFEQIPVSGHTIEIKNESIYLKVIGYPKVSRKFQFKEETAQKKKYPKDLLIRPDVINLCDSSTLVELIMGEESYKWDPKSKQFPFDVNAIPIAQFHSNCFLKINGSTRPKHIDWFQSNYIFPSKNMHQIETMSKSLMAYMDLVEKKRKALKEQKRKYESELMDKQYTIDSLIAVINKEPMIPYPFEEEEAIVAEMLLLPNIQAAPPFSEGKMDGEIIKIIRKYPTPFPTRIAIWFEIDQAGKVKFINSMNESNAEELIKEVIQYLTYYRWSPAEVGGRKVKETFVVEIETF